MSHLEVPTLAVNLLQSTLAPSTLIALSSGSSAGTGKTPRQIPAPSPFTLKRLSHSSGSEK
jgi:hypothetical protein